MILVTGAAGFIGSVMIWKLNEKGINNILIADKFHKESKWKNLNKRSFQDIIDRDCLFDWLEKYGRTTINTVIHLGACTNTMETDVDYILRTNYEYSKSLFAFCSKNKIPLIYASSAATYGAGEKGYTDNIEQINDLLPLNPYGWSKQLFDKWVLNQKEKPPQVAGLKFFNVYGPNEYHKGTMASVIYHAFKQVKSKGKISLFKSYKKNYNDGEQKRDFIYVKDVVECIFKIYEDRSISGIFNLGRGKARSFNELAGCVFKALSLKQKIKYIPMPEHLKNQYQYFTEAKMDKLLSIIKYDAFYGLEHGVSDYIRNYLNTHDPYI
ncbi:MAG: ADP-glyceromanno-heptose 6-epimerase [Spirochaetes bacterium]|nr:ADP-glyceromanno-heptose 6-epimerase [Spirochaetota bacterium]